MDKICFPKVRNLIKVIKLFRIDFFIFLYIVSVILPNVTRTQLIQDKYCINQLKLDPSKCLQLEQLGPEYDHFKNSVYVFSAKFNYYDIAISTPFGIISAILVGFWVDKYPGYTKYIIATPALGGFLGGILEILNVYYFKSSVYHILWRSVVYSLTGTMTTIYTGAYTYLTRRTNSKHRIIRFAIFDFSSKIASILGTALGGKLLTVSTFFGFNQSRNYYLVFLTSSISSLTAFIWILLTLNDTNDKIEDDENIDTKITSINNTRQLSNSDENKTGNFFSVILQVFRLSTITSMFKSVFRRRPAKRRTVLLHLTFGMIIAFMGILIEHTIGLQFAQKVYHWNSSYYSYFFSYLTLIPSLLNTSFPVFMSQIGGIFDSTYCIISSISLILSLAIKGGILEPYAFYVACIVGAFSPLIVTVKKSIISRIVDQNEAGQIFSLIVNIEHIATMIITLLFTQIFNATIEIAPGTANLVVAILMLYPYMLSLWLGLNVYTWDPAAIKYLEEKERIKLNVI